MEQTMNAHEFSFHGQSLSALPSGALWWPDAGLLCVSDLHFGKSERLARRGHLLPPYETQDTLARLQSDVETTRARSVLCLGDSFDDLDAAAALPDDIRLQIARLQAGRDWIWIEGNHDPGPLDLGGSHRSEMYLDPLTFRHIADPTASSEISGHYHPKVNLPTRGRRVSRRAFLVDKTRIILPAYGTYTGGLRSHDPVLCAIMQPDAIAILTGPVLHAIPMPR